MRVGYDRAIVSRSKSRVMSSKSTELAIPNNNNNDDNNNNSNNNNNNYNNSTRFVLYIMLVVILLYNNNNNVCVLPSTSRGSRKLSRYEYWPLNARPLYTYVYDLRLHMRLLYYYYCCARSQGLVVLCTYIYICTI